MSETKKQDSFAACSITKQLNISEVEKNGLLRILNGS